MLAEGKYIMRRKPYIISRKRSFAATVFAIFPVDSLKKYIAFHRDVIV